MKLLAIYPPTQCVIPRACYSCGSDVDMSCGFADLDKPAFKGYLCKACTIIAIGGIKASELLQNAQERYRESKGE